MNKPKSLFGAYSFRGLESMAFVVGDIAAGRALEQ